jgi:hypothetical protein
MFCVSPLPLEMEFHPHHHGVFSYICDCFQLRQRLDPGPRLEAHFPLPRNPTFLFHLVALGDVSIGSVATQHPTHNASS